MSMAALRWARSVRGITGTQKLVLFALADMANDYAEAWPSAKSLADDCCVDEKTVRLALDALEQLGLASGERATGRATRWRIHLDANPCVAPETAGPCSATSGGAPALTGKSGSGGNPGRSTRTTPGATPAPPRAQHPDTPGGAPDRTLKNPHRTPSEPSTRATPRAVVALPEWLPPDAWEAWCAHRVAKARKGWTHAAAVRCVATLEKLRDAGDDPREVIDQSIAGGWTGLFPLKNRSNGRSAEKARPWWMEDMISERH